MKKIWSFIFASILIVITLIGIKQCNNNEIRSDKNIGRILKMNIDERNSSIDVMNRIVDDKTALVFGSSELSSSDELAYPSYLFGNKDAFLKMLLIGRGHTQSLVHAITIGAYDDLIKNKKIVFILSAQWFTDGGIEPDAFASTYSKKLYEAMLNNKKISKATKEKISDRLDYLLSGSTKQKNEAESLKDFYINDKQRGIDYYLSKPLESFISFQNEYKIANQIRKVSDKDAGNIREKDFNFSQLLDEANRVGLKSCTNNNFAIYDSYYDKYIKDNVASLKDSASSKTFSKSQEYEDFKILLDICKELDINPLICIVPVNGFWYDHISFPKKERQAYYSKIRDICKQYDVKIADFSSKEYEKYFLSDIMHIGWKGWVYFDEAVVKFYQEKNQ